MYHFKRKFGSGIAAFACLSQATAWAGTYTFQTINNPADTTFNQLLGVNDAGTIVGYYGSGSATAPNKGYSVTLQSGTPVFTNENFPGSVQTQVVGINNTGTTVGFFVDGGGNNFGFTKTAGFTAVNNPNVGNTPTVTQLLGVNDHGVAAGFFTDANGNNQGFTYSNNSFNALGLPTGAVSATATGINNAGVVSGFYVDGAGATHGFWDNGGKFSSTRRS